MGQGLSPVPGTCYLTAVPDGIFDRDGISVYRSVKPIYRHLLEYRLSVVVQCPNVGTINDHFMPTALRAGIFKI